MKSEINVLLTVGGHGFQEEAFYTMFDSMEGVKFHTIHLPDSADVLRPGLRKIYDVIVMYDMVDSIAPSQQKAFASLLEEGIGLISLHHNLAAHRSWDEFPRIVGGRYFLATEILDGSEFPPSTYYHDQDIQVTVVDKAHPITAGMDNFQIHDETYKGYYTAPNVEILLKTGHPNSDPPLAWTTRYGRSPVFYLLLGHDVQAWRHPVYPRLLRNAILWAAKKRY